MKKKKFKLQSKILFPKRLLLLLLIDLLELNGNNKGLNFFIVDVKCILKWIVWKTPIVIAIGFCSSLNVFIFTLGSNSLKISNSVYLTLTSDL